MTDSTHKMEYYTTWNIKNFKERMYLETDTERLPGNIVKWEEKEVQYKIYRIFCVKNIKRGEKIDIYHII